MLNSITDNERCEINHRLQRMASNAIAGALERLNGDREQDRDAFINVLKMEAQNMEELNNNQQEMIKARGRATLPIRAMIPVKRTRKRRKIKNRRIN